MPVLGGSSGTVNRVSLYGCTYVSYPPEREEIRQVKWWVWLRFAQQIKPSGSMGASCLSEEENSTGRQLIRGRINSRWDRILPFLVA